MCKKQNFFIFQIHLPSTYPMGMKPLNVSTVQADWLLNLLILVIFKMTTQKMGWGFHRTWWQRGKHGIPCSLPTVLWGKVAGWNAPTEDSKYECPFQDCLTFTTYWSPTFLVPFFQLHGSTMNPPCVVLDDGVWHVGHEIWADMRTDTFVEAFLCWPMMLLPWWPVVT